MLAVEVTTKNSGDFNVCTSTHFVFGSSKCFLSLSAEFIFSTKTSVLVCVFRLFSKGQRKWINCLKRYNTPFI